MFSNLYGNRMLDEEASRILAGELLPTLTLLIKIVKIVKQSQESIKNPFGFHNWKYLLLQTGDGSDVAPSHIVDLPKVSLKLISTTICLTLSPPGGKSYFAKT